MSSKEIGLREARAKLGDLVTAAMYGQTTIITRNGRPAARIAPLEESSMDAQHSTDLIMPDELPVRYETTTGTRGDMSGPIPSLPRYWHVSVADRAARGDTLLQVMQPDGQAVASVTWAERLDEDSEELAEAVEWLTGAARAIWDAVPKLVQGAAPETLWAQVADAWTYAGQGAYFAWAKEVRGLGTAPAASL